MLKLASLAIDVFTVPGRPLIRPPRPLPPPGGWTWPPTAAVLISSGADAVLVDTLITIADAEKLADWIEAKRKRLKAIYVTHGHPDHYLGAPVLLKRFPKARLIALPHVVNDICQQLNSSILEKYWKPMFGGDVADGQIFPEPLTDGSIGLQGHEILAVQAGQSDTLHSTYLYIPELATVVAGDIVFNDVHMDMDATDHAKRAEWIRTLCQIDALNPKMVVAAHRRPDAADTRGIIAENIKYILDFDQILGTGVGALELIEEMKAAHPTKLNLTTLYDSAYMLAR